MSSLLNYEDITDGTNISNLLIHFVNNYQFKAIPPQLIDDSKLIDKLLIDYYELIETFIENLERFTNDCNLHRLKNGSGSEIEFIVENSKELVNRLQLINYDSILQNTLLVRNGLNVTEFEACISNSDRKKIEKYEKLKIDIEVNEKKLIEKRRERESKIEKKQRLETKSELFYKERASSSSSMILYKDEFCSENSNFIKPTDSEASNYSTDVMTKMNSSKVFTDSHDIVKKIGHSCDIVYVKLQKSFFKQNKKFSLEGHTYSNYSKVYVIITQKYDEIDLKLDDISHKLKNKIEIKCITTKENIHMIKPVKANLLSLKRETADDSREFLNKTSLILQEILNENRNQQNDIEKYYEKENKYLNEIELKAKKDFLKNEKQTQLAIQELEEHEEKSIEFLNKIVERCSYLSSEIKDLDEQINELERKLTIDKENKENLKDIISKIEKDFEKLKSKALSTDSNVHYLNKQLKMFENYLNGVQEKTNMIINILQTITLYLCENATEKIKQENLISQLKNIIQ